MKIHSNFLSWNLIWRRNYLFFVSDESKIKRKTFKKCKDWSTCRTFRGKKGCKDTLHKESVVDSRSMYLHSSAPSPTPPPPRPPHSSLPPLSNLPNPTTTSPPTPQTHNHPQCEQLSHHTASFVTRVAKNRLCSFTESWSGCYNLYLLQVPLDPSLPAVKCPVEMRLNFQRCHEIERVVQNISK